MTLSNPIRGNIQCFKGLPGISFQPLLTASTEQMQGLLPLPALLQGADRGVEGDHVAIHCSLNLAALRRVAINDKFAAAF